MEKLNRFKIYSSFISKNKISHLKSYISFHQFRLNKLSLSIFLSISRSSKHPISAQISTFHPFISLHLIDDFLTDSNELYLYIDIRIFISYSSDSPSFHVTRTQRSNEQTRFPLPSPLPSFPVYQTSLLRKTPRVTATFHYFGISPVFQIIG